MPRPVLRPSLGTAISLSLKKGALPHPPTTAYIMVGDRCLNNCAFCAQSRSSGVRNPDQLSRVTWPPFPYENVVGAMKGAREAGMGRICLQCLMEPTSISGLPEVVRDLRTASGLPVSVSISPVGQDMLMRIKEEGVDKVGIALDSASPEVFDRVKGRGVENPYSFEAAWGSLMTALEVFGRGRVSTHFIVGMGETDSELICSMVRCRELGILSSLFAYTPVPGTLELGPPPPLERYRALQLARHVIYVHGIQEGFDFSEAGKLTSYPRGLERGPSGYPGAFMTRGCPDCNRPYYTERPGRPLYNYPRPLSPDEVATAFRQAMSYVSGT